MKFDSSVIITINHVSNDSLSPIEVLSSEACFRHLKKKFISIHAKIRQKLRRRDTWTFLHHSVKCYKTIYETHDNDCVNTRKFTTIRHKNGRKTPFKRKGNLIIIVSINKWGISLLICTPCCGFYQNCEKARHVQRQIKIGILYCLLQNKKNIQDPIDLMTDVS
jgi:hypothetical protein